MYLGLVVFCSFAFLYSLIAHRIEHLPLSGPVIFLLFGFLVGPYGFGVFHISPESNDLRMIADLTLAIFLFVDAAKTHKKTLGQNYQLPLRLLLIGLPLTIVLGFVAAFYLFEDLGIYEMCLIAVMLAATDAALGKAVVSNPLLPERLSMGLNVESGLNDGLCVPLLLFFIALASASGAASEGGISGVSALELILHELGIGLVVGIVVSSAGAFLLNRAYRNHLITGAWNTVPTIMLALSCFGVAQELGGSGYIAAFIGGLCFRRGTGSYRAHLLDEAEGTGEVLAMATWVILGLFVIGETISLISWPVVIYALLSLTVIRMLPVYIALAKTGEKVESKLFVGWFGPRGLASIVFSVIVLDSNIPNGEFISVVVTTTVFLSAILHGITAAPATDALAKKLGHQQSSG